MKCFSATWRSHHTANSQQPRMTSIESLQKENAELRLNLYITNEKIERSNGIISQLIGGLFNQKTQSCSMNWLLDFLEGENTYPQKQCNHSPEECSIWPTTRQGDENEKRLLKLEETIKKLEKQVQILEETINRS